jgi:hypothetical protein
LLQAGDDVECNLGSIAEEADAVTADCCDGAGDDCGGGTSVAKTCDILCATRFVGFYERCGDIMKAMDEQRAAAFKSLYTTCKDGLPLGPLLSAVAECAGKTLASLTLSGKGTGNPLGIDDGVGAAATAAGPVNPQDILPFSSAGAPKATLGAP